MENLKIEFRVFLHQFTSGSEFSEEIKFQQIETSIVNYQYLVELFYKRFNVYNAIRTFNFVLHI